MENKNYSTTVELAATPAEVFNHINNVSNWWMKDFKGKSTQLNDEFSVTVPGRHYSKHKLIEVIPDKKIVWLVTDSNLNWIENDKHEWTGTKMVFELEPKGNKTALTFTHEGLVPGQECYANCVRGWNMLITDRLSSYIMEGGDKALF